MHEISDNVVWETVVFVWAVGMCFASLCCFFVVFFFYFTFVIWLGRIEQLLMDSLSRFSPVWFFFSSIYVCQSIVFYVVTVYWPIVFATHSITILSVYLSVCEWMCVFERNDWHAIQWKTGPFLTWIEPTGKLITHWVSENVWEQKRWKGKWWHDGGGVVDGWRFRVTNDFHLDCCWPHITYCSTDNRICSTMNRNFVNKSVWRWRWLYIGLGMMKGGDSFVEGIDHDG